ncbi:MAG: nucleotide sugar dehydrogenase [Alphaproteobacteria bacterium]
MKIGFIGLGKLGFPCALAMAAKGHDVLGYDLNAENMNNHPRGYTETCEDGVTHINNMLHTSKLRFGGLQTVVDHGDLLFVAVQTPHDPHFEGITRLPAERTDFDYRYLIEAIKNISAAARTPKKVIIVSTVLPGAIRNHILPHASGLLSICYNPYFIAMGTTIKDFLHPEFILLGVHDAETARTAEEFYATICNAPIYRTSIENAELIKVAYNTYIGMKIAFANVLMEICHKMPGCDVDAVVGGLKLAHRRIISTAYMDGGMGDGGGCHPRDNIALSWLARKLDLSYDWFESVMTARERQTEWLADLMCTYSLPKGIIGYAFKAKTNICVGSPALLLANILKARGYDVFRYDPVVEQREKDLSQLPPHVFLIGTNHPQFTKLTLPKGSVVIDPWRFVSVNDGVHLVAVGRVRLK